MLSPINSFLKQNLTNAIIPIILFHCKKNIANVFNAETIIEGLMAGVFAIAVVMLVSLPVNAIVANAFDVQGILALPWSSAIILICISVVLTFVAGLIPSTAASRRDPVEALRSE